MIPPFDPADRIRRTATTLDSRREVVETVLALPAATYLALETIACQHRMTIGQMARLLITRGLAVPHSLAISASAGPE